MDTGDLAASSDSSDSSSETGRLATVRLFLVIYVNVSMMSDGRHVSRLGEPTQERTPPTRPSA